jgi:hypothetical protein
MAGEVATPILPCRAIDDVAGFYGALGFAVTYRQERPNPYVALRREDLELHFFGLEGFEPEDSYGTCSVRVPDVLALHRAFADGLRAAYGRVPTAGIPRMTRPRRKQDRVTGFSVVDPGGNWIRIAQARAAAPAAGREDDAAPTRLGRALFAAGVLGDAKGDAATAARVLDKALAGETADESGAELAEALVLRAELAVALGDDAGARAALTRLRSLSLDDAERERARDALAGADDLERALPAG